MVVFANCVCLEWLKICSNFIATLVSSGIYLDKLLLILMLIFVPRFSY